MAQVELVRAFKDGNIVVALGELQAGDTFSIRGDGTTYGGAIQLNNPTNTFNTMLTGGPVTSDVRLTLPSTGGTPGQIIYTDGAGNWDYTSTIQLDNLTVPNIQVSVTDTQTIDTTAGNLVLDSATGETQINDNLTVAGNHTVTGNLIVNGTTTTVNSTTVTVDDPVFTLGGDTAAASDDGLDRGIEFQWHDGGGPKLGFFGWDRSASKFTFIPDATNSGEVFSGAVGNVAFANADFTGNVIPTADLTYDLGTPALRWNNLYVGNMASDGATFGNIQIGITDDQTIDTVSGNLVVNSATGNVNVTAANTNLSGILSVTGASNLTGNVTMVANATVGGTLGVTGATTLSDTLGVTGATTLSDTLGVTGATTLSSTLGVTGATTLSSTLGVTGATTLSANLTVNGNTTLGNATSDTLTVTSRVNSHFVPSADVTYDLGTSALQWNTVYAQNIAADSTTFGDIQIGTSGTNEIDTSSGNLILDSAGGTTQVDDDLSVTGASTLTGDVGMTANATVGGTLGVTGNTTLSTVTASGNATFNSDVIVSGLTPTRVVYVGASDQLVDSANMTFDGTTLTTTAINVDNITIDGSSISSTAALNLSPDVVIAGNLTVTGTTTTVNSTVVTVEDPVMTLGSNASDDNKDRGIEFLWNNGTARTGFFGWDDSASVFTVIPLATNSSEVFSGTPGNVRFGNGTFTGTVTAAGFSGPLTGNAATATKLATARTISLGGDATGSATFDGSGNITITAEVTQADTWETARTITLAGDATGSVSINGSSNVTLTVAVVNDSHTHDTRYYTETEVNTLLTAKAELNDLSVTTAAAAGNGALAYNNSNGVFTFTPADVPTVLTDLGITDGTTGQVLTTNGSGTFTFSDVATILSGPSKYLNLNGSTNTFTITAGHTVDTVLVFYNGICLVPTSDYTVSGTTLTTTFTPIANSDIVIRYFPI